MANNYTQFSTMLALDSAEQVERALAMAGAAPDEFEDIGFNVERDEGNLLWIYADECGSPDAVRDYVTRVAKEFGITGMWGFAWSESCSKPRVNEFGGGAIVVDLATGESQEFTTYEFLSRNLK